MDTPQTRYRKNRLAEYAQMNRATAKMVFDEMHASTSMQPLDLDSFEFCGMTVFFNPYIAEGQVSVTNRNNTALTRSAEMAVNRLKGFRAIKHIVYCTLTEADLASAEKRVIGWFLNDYIMERFIKPSLARTNTSRFSMPDEKSMFGMTRTETGRSRKWEPEDMPWPRMLPGSQKMPNFFSSHFELKETQVHDAFVFEVAKKRQVPKTELVFKRLEPSPYFRDLVSDCVDAFALTEARRMQESLLDRIAESLIPSRQLFGMNVWEAPLPPGTVVMFDPARDAADCMAFAIFNHSLMSNKYIPTTTQGTDSEESPLHRSVINTVESYGLSPRIATIMLSIFDGACRRKGTKIEAEQAADKYRYALSEWQERLQYYIEQNAAKFMPTLPDGEEGDTIHRANAIDKATATAEALFTKIYPKPTEPEPFDKEVFEAHGIGNDLMEALSEFMWSAEIPDLELETVSDDNIHRIINVTQVSRIVTDEEAQKFHDDGIIEDARDPEAKQPIPFHKQPGRSFAAEEFKEVGGTLPDLKRVTKAVSTSGFEMPEIIGGVPNGETTGPSVGDTVDAAREEIIGGKEQDAQG